MFEPPSTEGTVILPGFDGGGEWGGAAFDEQTGTLYVNGNEMAWILTMVPRAQGQSAGRTVYLNNCAGCHGLELKGAPPAFPSLDTITPRLDSQAIATILNNGRGRMNAFKHLPDYQKKDVIRYLLKKEDQTRRDRHSNEKIKDDEYMQDYLSTGYHRFFDMNGYPALTPPWGTLNAIDLNEGKIIWTVPLGELQELTAKGIQKTGTENYGGPLITASGLLFIGASKDEMFRAFDTRTGKTLWEYQLPAGGYATPATYQIKGRQYIVIAAGGGKMGTKSGNKYIAFALPAQ
jgi:quinoprotein glucose dehydrogenase